MVLEISCNLKILSNQVYFTMHMIGLNNEDGKALVDSRSEVIYGVYIIQFYFFQFDEPE